MKKQFHVISTGRQSTEQVVAIASQIHPYVDAIHLREKTKTAKELAEMMEELLFHGVPKEKLVVNDRVDVAIVYGVKVQLAFHSLSVRQVKECFPSLSVGCSVHSQDEAKEAEDGGADYCIYGHVFPTASKRGVPPRGIEALAQIVGAVRIPVIAIGGIQPHHVPSVWEAGAAGIAVMSGVFCAEDPLREVKRYRQMF
ncbi:thiazole tautomerase (transcriptional regulator TenI) [Anoxybacillus voinovskiensis]|uniref:Thiazole tautomerase (Transcriptional regulator TenI) n=1 Tax=Anoxybacteroides voinovskiense TaxID=230470 RepID=A0A840DNQ4_9BACL|nr:thiazole tautomerase TenI [Anoxybacillus voinovskiensis]MBB4074831.1 thiazole tautomerase (transcriptional regulator TenI) [Anoxybacillus voinovskiensis]GGJ73855.1 thiamine phosphate synthase [Anoxybacillus voinovskiensis]